jgi:hypothetical protein
MRGDPEFDRIWAEYFAAHPEVLASWSHQNGYLPPGYGESPELPVGAPLVAVEED